jgi:hypothetical protein
MMITHSHSAMPTVQSPRGGPVLLSRSKLSLFMECPRCFYLDLRRGIRRPTGPPFSLNNAVDLLLKREFDVHRAAGTTHPLMVSAGITATPFAHPDIDLWRSRKGGLSTVHEETGFLAYGLPDDIWIESGTGNLIIADYKATAKASEVSLDADWQISYKRQVEFYQWVLRGMGFPVSDTAWFVYCNGDVSLSSFDEMLKFNITMLPHVGNTDWIEPSLRQAAETYSSEEIPAPADSCIHCKYAADANRGFKTGE